jgi:hypothetical protein
MNLQSKSLEITGRIELAEIALADAQQVLVQAHLNDADTDSPTSGVQAAKINLDALHTVRDGLEREINDENDAALQAKNEKAAKVQVAKSERYLNTVQKADEFLILFVQEINRADMVLADLAASGSVDLKAAVRGASSPLAIATAAKLAQTSPRFLEDLAMALQRYKSAAFQCNGRTMADMAINPASL